MSKKEPPRRPRKIPSPSANGHVKKSPEAPTPPGATLAGDAAQLVGAMGVVLGTLWAMVLCVAVPAWAMLRYACYEAWRGPPGCR